jgi:preprotein translocase subunit YajC
MAEEKKEAAAASTGGDAPVMSQGKASDTKATVGVDSSSKSAPAAAAGGSDWTSMLPMIGSMILVFYFLMIRPEKKRRQQQLAMMSSMKKGDKVVLASVGIYGTIADLDGDDATVIIDAKKDVRIKVRKESIAGVVDTEEKK